MRRKRWGMTRLALCLPVVLAAGVLGATAGAGSAAAGTPPVLNLKVLLIGEGSADVTTAAWQSALTSEGVPFTLVTATGTAPNESVNLPALSSGTTGNYNGVVIADSPTDYAAGALSALDSYESSFGVRQVDGYMFPSPALGVTEVAGGEVGGTTATLTAAGLAAFPALKGPVPFDTGTFGYAANVNPGAPYTPFLANSDGQAMAGVYQHPGNGDPQAGVAELALNFDYNASQLQWLLLAPGLVNWVTQGTHLGLYRNYFGQDVDDIFIPDNEWSQQFQCIPAASDPPDPTCPPGVSGNAADTPPNSQMSAADVAHVTDWEQQTGIRLNLAFNAQGACSADTAADESGANCTGSVTDNGTTYTDPGQVDGPGLPNAAGLVNALLAAQGDFNWISHTWSHMFLGCQNAQPQAVTSAVASSSGGTLAAGSYSYKVTAATAYGESEPSAPQPVTATANGSVTITWPEATNGTSTDGSIPGPSLAKEQATHTGGTGFWGYNIYREDPGASTYGLVGQVAENPAATSSTTYSFTDTGGTAPGNAPTSTANFPTATNPGIDCASGADAWLPATSTEDDSSIEQEIGLNQAFAAANGLTNYTPAAVVTGEHSGVENPNMPAALAGVGVTTFAQDASRQPQQYSLGAALGEPRYPSNIFFNASNWPNELNEYNTLYVSQGTSLGNPTFPDENGHCRDTSTTTCISAPATEAGVLASETHIMLRHVLANDPRMSYAHQSNLVGPATQGGQDYGYTLLSLLNSMLGQYGNWYTAGAPLDQVTDVSGAQTLAEQAAWATAAAGGGTTASEQNGVVTVANTGSAAKVPVTVPPGTTVSGTPFGQAYGGSLSDWVSLGAGASTTLTEHVTPAFSSSASSTAIVGTPFSFTVAAAGAPAPSITETGALPGGLTLQDNGNGTATIAGTPAAGSGGSYPIVLTATNSGGSVTQNFTLTVAEAPAITSPSTATFTIGVAGTYTITTTGTPAPAITETGPLPGGLTFTDNGTGTGTISGTAASGTAGTYPVTLKATNASGSTATLALTITVQTAAAPTITSGNIAFFTLNQAGATAVTATGAPTPAISETGTLPAGLAFADNGNGTALLSGTGTSTGTASLTMKASNGISPDATQAYSAIVGQAPAFTSTSSAVATVGAAFSFTAKAGGYPVPSWGESNLPPGITFTDNKDGTATFAGTPTAPGTYAMPLLATNAYGSAQQTLTITVQQAPAITSGNSATFTVGTQGSFSVTTTGSPVAAVTTSGTLPAGVTFTDNGNGSATLAGTPAAGTSGSYPITITAANGVSPSASQSFTLTVNAAPTAPTITSGNSAAFTVGTQGSFSVMTTGSPVAAVTESGALPAGVTFTDNGNGSATLAGTPAAGTSGSYPITISAANGVSPKATQSFTLTVNPAAVAPSITSASSATFAATKAGSFTVTTSGTPAATLSATSSPALPAGVTFTSKGDGTATLAGTPPAGSQGTYLMTIKATNSAGTASQSFTLTVNGGLSITSAATATATAGQAFSFTVTTTGTPAPALTRTGTLPPGLTFTANSNGTATLAGTPAAADSGPYPLTFTAKNSAGTASQAFTLTVNQAPAFTSPAAVAETAGTAFTFGVSATGYPVPKLTSGTLPAGVKFSDNGNGTGLLSGTTAVQAGTYPVTVTAVNAGGTTSQAITLTVTAAGTVKQAVPVFTSAATATEPASHAFTFKVTTVGSPTPYTVKITRSGAMPAGVNFSNNGDGTAVLFGTPGAASGGTFPLTFTASDKAGTTTQQFVLVVPAVPAITSPASATATTGAGFNFTVKANGFPAPRISESGVLPQGMSWTDNTNGTASLAGTPGVGQGGSYKLTFTATNSGGTTTQAFTLVVDQAPVITSAATATATHGKAFSFTFSASGYPAPTITHTGTVRGLAYTSNANGTVTLAGTPAAAGTYNLTITAKNSSGSVTQAFTLKVS